jgi:hypothetical protein
MIPCDREIEALLEDGSILIEPRPDKRLWSPTAIDLTLDKVLLRWSPQPLPSGKPNHPRPMAPNFNVQAMMEDPGCASKIDRLSGKSSVAPEGRRRVAPGESASPGIEETSCR